MRFYLIKVNKVFRLPSDPLVDLVKLDDKRARRSDGSITHISPHADMMMPPFRQADIDEALVKQEDRLVHQLKQKKYVGDRVKLYNDFFSGKLLEDKPKYYALTKDGRLKVFENQHHRDDYVNVCGGQYLEVEP